MTALPARRDLPASPYLDAAAGRGSERIPVWFMRQAGRSLPEYRELRAQRDMLDSCLDADLVCEITMQPVRRHGVDAAILFSDIVVPLLAAGVGLDIVAGVGPVIDEPLRRAEDVDRLGPLDTSNLAPVSRAVSLLIGELGSVPLIGFAGAPFTLASYLVEGGPSRNHARTKAMMLGDPPTWRKLMAKLTNLTVSFLELQLDAGVDAVQMFDSWAGTLTAADYRERVLPYSAQVFTELRGRGVPMTHFGVGTAELLNSMAEALAGAAASEGGAGAVVGVDWRTPLADAAERIGGRVSLQGNLDPAVLLAGWSVVERAARAVVDDGRRAVAAGAAAHVFNLGHGVLPDTDPGVLTDLVELVHSL